MKKVIFYTKNKKNNPKFCLKSSVEEKPMKKVIAFIYLFLYSFFVFVYAEDIKADERMSDVSALIEKEVLQELNLARTKPKLYAEKIKKMRQYFNGNRYEVPGKVTIITKEGVKAVNEAIAFLEKVDPLPEFSYSKGISKACRDHILDQGPSGYTGHTGNDGSTPFDRMNRYGRWKGVAGENISYGKNTAEEIVIQLIVDDGVLSRGHRENIFNPQFRVVGIAFGSHAKYKYMCVMGFAADYEEKDISQEDSKIKEEKVKKIFQDLEPERKKQEQGPWDLKTLEGKWILKKVYAYKKDADEYEAKGKINKIAIIKSYSVFFEGYSCKPDWQARFSSLPNEIRKEFKIKENTGILLLSGCENFMFNKAYYVEKDMIIADFNGVYYLFTRQK